MVKLEEVNSIVKEQIDSKFNNVSEFDDIDMEMLVFDILSNLIDNGFDKKQFYFIFEILDSGATGITLGYQVKNHMLYRMDIDRYLKERYKEVIKNVK